MSTSISIYVFFSGVVQVTTDFLLQNWFLAAKQNHTFSTVKKTCRRREQWSCTSPFRDRWLPLWEALPVNGAGGALLFQLVNLVLVFVVVVFANSLSPSVALFILYFCWCLVTALSTCEDSLVSFGNSPYHGQACFSYSFWHFC